MHAEKSVSEDAMSISSKRNPIVFDTAMRKHLAACALDSIKSLIEQKTCGEVEVSIEDTQLSKHEFSMKLVASKHASCSKQMFNEASGAIINAVNYMFLGDDEDYSISTCTSSKEVEVELVSNW